MKLLEEQMLCFKIRKKYSKIASLHKFRDFKKNQTNREQTVHHLAPVFTQQIIPILIICQIATWQPEESN